jgi:hypothetical protein
MQSEESGRLREQPQEHAAGDGGGSDGHDEQQRQAAAAATPGGLGSHALALTVTPLLTIKGENRPTDFAKTPGAGDLAAARTEIRWPVLVVRGQ